METIWIYPETVGMSEWGNDWLEFCLKMGFDSYVGAIQVVILKEKQ